MYPLNVLDSSSMGLHAQILPTNKLTKKFPKSYNIAARDAFRPRWTPGTIFARFGWFPKAILHRFLIVSGYGIRCMFFMMWLGGGKAEGEWIFHICSLYIPKLWLGLAWLWLWWLGLPPEQEKTHEMVRRQRYEAETWSIWIGMVLR